MSLFSDLNALKDQLRLSERMPCLFLGHGTPMNAIEDNQYSKMWTRLGKTLPKPQAILVISAHWMSQGTTLVDISDHPRTIHDFYNFPQKLYEQNYPAPGAPELAADLALILADHVHVKEDDSWGLDHGAWSVLKWLYPDANIPSFQLSIDMSKDLSWHLELGQHLNELRDMGVLILGSGNVVHNLSQISTKAPPHSWAIEFDTKFSDFLSDRNFDALTDDKEFGKSFHLSHPSFDHYIPALVVCGSAHKNDHLTFANADIDLASISMRSFIFY